MAPMRLTMALTALAVMVTASHGREGGRGETSRVMRGVGAEAAHGRGGARAHARGGRTRALNTSAAQRGVSGHDKRREARSKVHHVGTSGIELRAGKQELCSHTVPQALVPSGLAGLCIIIDEGSAICGSQVMLEVKMAGDEGAVLFNKPLDLSQLQTCATAQEMHSTPIITNVCGYNATICVDFMRSGQNTLGLECEELGSGGVSLIARPDQSFPNVEIVAISFVSEESLAGCPTIYIVDCFLGPTPLPPLPFQLDCKAFPSVNSCKLSCIRQVSPLEMIAQSIRIVNLASRMDVSAIARDVERADVTRRTGGWCSAGYSNQHSCKPGNASGALCNGEESVCRLEHLKLVFFQDCGVPDCNCDWNFGMCPVPEADLEANEAKLFWLCSPSSLPSSEAAPGTNQEKLGGTAECSCRIAFGKAGYWDMIFRRRSARQLLLIEFDAFGQGGR
eukprot:753053-Hanusia_phi.AAC.3